MGTERPFEGEYDGLDLGDERRNRRAKRVGEQLAAHPGLSLPQAFPSDVELEGTYRLLGNEEVTAEALLAPHVRRTLERAEEVSQPLVAIHDTTQLSFGGEYFRDGLGCLPNGGQGFFAHVSLLAAHDGEVSDALGVLRAETLFRDEPKKKRGGYAISQADDSEGLRWGRAVEEVESLLGVGRAIHVCDREADAYLLQAQLQANQARYIIRSKYDRRALDDSGESTRLWPQARAVSQMRVLRQVRLLARNSGELKTPSKSGRAVLKGSSYQRTPANKKAHPPRYEREAELCVTASQHLLVRPNVEGRPCAEQLAVNVVRVFEVSAPEGCAPVEWLLLTSLPIDTQADVERIVDAYRLRWLIEEFFKALKSGCGYEKLQLEGRQSLLNALAIYLSCAWRLLRLRTFSRMKSDLLASSVLTPTQLELLGRLRPKAHLSSDSTVRSALLAVASLGGHIKNNGDPGWSVIGRGFDELLKAEVGYFLAKQEM